MSHNNVISDLVLTENDRLKAEAEALLLRRRIAAGEVSQQEFDGWVQAQVSQIEAELQASEK